MYMYDNSNNTIMAVSLLLLVVSLAGLAVIAVFASQDYSYYTGPTVSNTPQSRYVDESTAGEVYDYMKEPEWEIGENGYQQTETTTTATTTTATATETVTSTEAGAAVGGMEGTVQVTVSALPLEISSVLGPSGQFVQHSWMTITAAQDVNVAKIVLTLANAKQLQGYFNQLDVVVIDPSDGEVKAVLSILKPTVVLVLDKDELSAGVVTLDAAIHYESHEGVTFDTLPVIVEARVESVS
ncbi:hypothetical protein [Pyrodictium abyssi]|uniref:Uncharacterized protein n=1 Tax=Pyrodictium abyssi TaxID=54256 RepID=A0ABN6ZL03_9CREN|nr:hypothetical protein PABY_04780 [Pyrodictium abyssi]